MKNASFHHTSTFTSNLGLRRNLSILALSQRCKAALHQNWYHCTFVTNNETLTGFSQLSHVALQGSDHDDHSVLQKIICLANSNIINQFYTFCKETISKFVDTRRCKWHLECFKQVQMVWHVICKPISTNETVITKSWQYNHHISKGHCQEPG